MLMKQKGIAYTKERFYELLTHQGDEITYNVLAKIIKIEEDARNDVLGFIVEWDGKGNMKEITAVVAKTVEVARYEFEASIMLVKIYPV